jgi:hypothetical protein
MGTCVRFLSGEKVWIFAIDMDAKEDWDDFAQDGPNWGPAHERLVIVLEKDDVLLISLSFRTLHNIFTLRPSLIGGGMLWAECKTPTLRKESLCFAQN